MKHAAPWSEHTSIMYGQPLLCALRGHLPFFPFPITLPGECPLAQQRPLMQTEQPEGVFQSCKTAACKREESKEGLIKALVCPLSVWLPLWDTQPNGKYVAFPESIPLVLYYTQIERCFAWRKLQLITGFKRWVSELISQGYTYNFLSPSCNFYLWQLQFRMSLQTFLWAWCSQRACPFGPLPQPVELQAEEPGGWPGEFRGSCQIQISQFPFNSSSLPAAHLHICSL